MVEACKEIQAEIVSHQVMEINWGCLSVEATGTKRKG